MRHIIPHVLAGIFILAPVGAGAAVIECKAEPPSSRAGYWSWRIIDGKRCWYLGKPGLAKSQLKWRRSEAAPGRVSSTPGRPVPEPVAIETRSSLSNETQSPLPNTEELTFEMRWPR
jgi:hypothetical protein